jgi:hypothetical protein
MALLEAPNRPNTGQLRSGDRRLSPTMESEIARWLADTALEARDVDEALM